MSSSDWFVYIIRCGDNTLYTGVTTDVGRRFEEHKSMGDKAAKYLKGRGPLQLVYQCMLPSKNSAYQAEWHIKKLSKLEKESLIASGEPFCI